MTKENVLPTTTEEIDLSVFQKYLEIKQDLVQNIKEIFLRRNYYTKKYRGNILTDIFVGLDVDEHKRNRITIFVRHKDRYIKDVLLLHKREIIDSNIKANIEW